MKRAKDVRCEILVSIKQDISFRTKTGFETTLCPGKVPNVWNAKQKLNKFGNKFVSVLGKKMSMHKMDFLKNNFFIWKCVPPMLPTRWIRC